jgi:hypothetical protein
MNARTPLLWPAHTRRAKYRAPAQFATDGITAIQHLRDQVRLLGGKDLIITTNLRVGRYTDLPVFSEKPQGGDPAVAVYFTLDGEEVCFACDRWTLVEDNIRAIGKTIEALRGIERWGTSDMRRAAFTGFAALPAGGSAWHQVLGVSPTASKAEIEAAYRRLVKTTHPDAGGDRERFLEIQRAYQEARAA